MSLKVIFMGTPDFAVPTLQAIAASSHQVVLAVTQPDRPKGRSRKLSEPPVKVAARELGIPIFQPEKVNSPESLARLQAEQADVCVVAAYGQLLSARVLDQPRLGSFNLHGSLLPKYRGAAPIAYAILNGEQETGLTIFRIVRKMDAGEMAMRVPTRILPDETAGDLHDRLSELGAEMFVEFLDGLEAGTILLTPQDESQVSFAPSFTKEEGEVDWRLEADRVCCHVRAMAPWPGAFAFLVTRKGELRVTLLKTTAHEAPSDAPPGEIVEVNETGFSVACGAGLVSVERLLVAGKRAMEAAEFLRGHPLRVGDRFRPGPASG